MRFNLYYLSHLAYRVHRKKIYVEVKMVDTFFGGLLSMIASDRQEKLGIKFAIVMSFPFLTAKVTEQPEEISSLLGKCKYLKFCSFLMSLFM